jgi:hypothetical protein
VLSQTHNYHNHLHHHHLLLLLHLAWREQLPCPAAVDTLHTRCNRMTPG